MTTESDASFELDDPADVLKQTRDRFIEAFNGRCASLAVLLDALAHLGEAGPLDSSRRIAHQMCGLAGTLGFPSVSESASDLEQLIVSVPTIGADRVMMHGALDGLKAAFQRDLARPLPDWATTKPVAASATAPKILVVEDDPSQRAVVTSTLQGAGYRVAGVDNGAEAFDAARFERPDLILLDIDLPGADGYSVCRRLKTSADLCAIPVIFMTTRSRVDDRLTGLALGADDYLIKPVDGRELTLRIQLLIKRSAPARASAAPAPAPAPAPASALASAPASAPALVQEPTSAPSPAAVPIVDRVLTYEAFVLAGQEALGKAACSLALIRLPRGSELAVSEDMLENARRRDFVGRLNDGHLLLLMPDTSAAAAVTRLREQAASLAARAVAGLVSGIAASTEGGASLEALLNEADEALNEARYLGDSASTKSDRTREGAARARATILLADDDPDIIRILDAQMRAAGYETVVAFDGAAALAAAIERTPDLVVLDLMMPKLTGFDVLRRLAESGLKPKSIVLSARGREEDVTRAFELGADDYITKPFSPQELMARASRLLR